MAMELEIKPERIQKLFDDLETQKIAISTCTQLFASLSSHFDSLQRSLSEKSQSLQSKFQEMESSSLKTLESLEAREKSIPERESAAVARIEELRGAALADLERSEPEIAELPEALRSISRKMDSAGLMSFIVSKRKESVALRAEISRAVNEAVDPPRLVLDAVEEFVNVKAGKGSVTDKRWACAMLVQALFPEVDSGDKSPELSRSVVERAGGLAEAWKVQMDGDAKALGPTEALMFLQMVVGFGLRSRFDDEFLRRLVVEYASRRDMVKRVAGLGFGEKIEDIIEELVKNGKEIEAVNFAFEFNLTEKFAPVPLLKSYLRKSRKKPGNMSTEEAYSIEFNSIKAIIKCVEDHKFEAEYPLDNLRKRVTNMEKSKAERRKSSGPSSQPPNKRPHGGGSGGPPFRAPKAAKYSNAYPSFNRRNQPPLPHHSPATRYSAPYGYPSQSVYEPSPAPTYASQYSMPHSQPPQQHYSHAGDVGARGNSAYGGQPSYSAYDYSSTAPPAYQPSPYTQ